MSGVPRQEADARQAGRAIGIDGDDPVAGGDAVEAGHPHGVLGVAAAAVQHDHDRRRRRAASEVVHEVGPLAAAMPHRPFGRAGAGVGADLGVEHQDAQDDGGQRQRREGAGPILDARRGRARRVRHFER